ncbi:MAG: hybrid sensor histidine kinase/response regulator [Arcobacteraceae bacterium]
MKEYENIKQYTILYIEDEKQSVELVSCILKERVKEIFVAYDGRDGLEKYKIHRPDIVISDIQMPHMNGIELSKKIKAINPKQNIILITAFNENSALLEAINLGITKYIVKPIICIENLLQPINDICKILSFDKNSKEKARLQAMQEVLKSIAHHWRQPLNIISLESSSVKIEMEMGTFEEKNLTLKLDHIYNTTQELSQMINNFINMFQFNPSEEKKPFLLSTAIEASLAKLEELIEKNSITIIAQIEEYEMTQDQTLFEKIIFNILQNSIEAIIENSLPKERYILIETKIEQCFIEVSVQDSGGGIDKQTLSKVFEPYFSQRKVHSGSGMGLFITKKIIENQFDSNITISNQSFKADDKTLYGTNVSLTFNL